MKRPLLLLALAAAMTTFLAFMVISHEHARRSGTEVVLNMELVDPRSLFRGHFVRVQTDLQRINIKDVEGDTDFAKGDRVYITLKGNNDDGWTPASLSHGKPSGTLLQGRVRSVSKRPETSIPENGNGSKADTASNRIPASIRIQYAVESYFASKPEAKALEAKTRDRKHKLRLILSVDKAGRPVIRGLEIDGNRYIDKL